MTETTTMSPSLEDYLETILDLYKENDVIRVTDLAEKLDVAKSSVNQAVKKLVEMKMITHDHYGPLELTELGAEEAQKIRERHLLLKQFFVGILGVDQKTAEKDACTIEHYISPVTMERLLKYVQAVVVKPENVNLKKD